MNNDNKINMDKFTLCPNCTTNIPLLTISYIDLCNCAFKGKMTLHDYLTGYSTSEIANSYS